VYNDRLDHTLTQGIVSGVGRELQGSGMRGVPIKNVIQTDAAINPGINPPPHILSRVSIERETEIYLKAPTCLCGNYRLIGRGVPGDLLCLASVFPVWPPPGKFPQVPICKIRIDIQGSPIQAGKLLISKDDAFWLIAEHNMVMAADLFMSMLKGIQCRSLAGSEPDLNNCPKLIAMDAGNSGGVLLDSR